MKTKVLFVCSLILFLPLAGAVNLTANFSGVENGQRVDNLDSGPVFPDDTGKWAIDFEVNETSEIWLVLEKTLDRENSCEEPENEPVSSCNDTGELDEVIEITEFIDQDRDLQHDQGEALNPVGEGLNSLENPETANGSFEADTEYTLLTNWSIPLDAGNRFMSDSVSYNLTIAANRSASSNEPAETISSNSETSSNSFESSSTREASIGSSTDEETDPTDKSETQLNGSLMLSVTDNDGEPVNASLNFEEIDRTVSTDTDGKINISLKQGNYSINVTAEGFQRKIRQVEITQGDEKKVEIVLSLESIQSTIEGETSDLQEDIGTAATGDFITSDSVYPYLGASILIVIGGAFYLNQYRSQGG